MKKGIYIGYRISYKRKKQRVSKKVLSEKTGFSIRVIEYWES